MRGTVDCIDGPVAGGRRVLEHDGAGGDDLHSLLGSPPLLLSFQKGA
jgi:hypothetical protein